MNRADIRQFALLAKEITKRLGFIESSIVKTSNTQIKAIAEQTKAYEKASEPRPANPLDRIKVEVDFPTPQAQRYYTEQIKSYRIQCATLLVTLFTLIALGVYTVYTRRIWLESKKSADAAKDAADTARDALTSAQRAFVTFGQSMQINTVNDNTGQRVIAWDFRPVMVNSGGTPTRNATHRINWMFQPAAMSNDYTFPDLPSAPPVLFVMAPKDIKTGALAHIDVNVINQVRSHTAHLYFWGWVTYRDIFKGTAEHVSMFCSELNDIPVDPTRPNISTLTFWSSCSPRHNCSDEDCNGEHYNNGQIWHSGEQ